MEESRVPTVQATCWRLSGHRARTCSSPLCTISSLHSFLRTLLTGHGHELELLLHGTYFPLCVLFWVTECTKIFCKWFIIFVCDLWKYAQTYHIFVSSVTQNALEFRSLTESVDPVLSLWTLFYLLISVVANSTTHPDLSWWAGACLLIDTCITCRDGRMPGSSARWNQRTVGGFFYLSVLTLPSLSLVRYLILQIFPSSLETSLYRGEFFLWNNGNKL